MKQVATILGFGLVGLILIVYLDNRETVSIATDRAADIAVDWFAALLWSLLALAIVTVLGLLYLAYLRGYRPERERIRDGQAAIREYRIRKRFGIFGGVRVLVDPNLMQGAAALIGDHGYIEVDAISEPVRLEVQRTRHLGAMYPGDAVLATQRAPRAVEMPKITESTRKLTQPATPKTAAALPGPVTPVTPPAVPRLTTMDALRRSTPDAWIVGQSATGALATFDPRRHAHAAIVGSTGTGKTTSVGYSLVLQAMRQHYHCIILDPDGGADWRPFRAHVEWHEADRGTFADQVATVHRVFESRRDEDGGLAEIFMVVEEYGDLIQQIRTVKRGDADHIDAMLDTLLRRGRKRGVHLCFIDQYPEHWSQQVIGGTKFRAVFQLGPNQGAKLEEYKAAQLADRGVFLLRGEQYQSWNVAAELPALLTNAPRQTGPRIIDGSVVRLSGEPDGGGATSGSGQPDTPADTDTDTMTDAQQRIIDYYTANPDAGVREAARALGLSKTYVSDVRRTMVEGDDRPPASIDAFGRNQTVIDMTDPASAAVLAEIRQAIANGQAAPKGRKA